MSGKNKRVIAMLTAVAGFCGVAYGLASDYLLLSIAGFATIVGSYMIATSARPGRPRRTTSPTSHDASDSTRFSLPPEPTTRTDLSILACSDPTPHESSSPPHPPERVNTASAGTTPDPPASGSAPRAFPRTPVPASIDPRSVLVALAEAIGADEHLLSTHLWLEDATTETARLVVSIGSACPNREPISIEQTTIGRALTTGTAVLAHEGSHRESREDHDVWRLAVPLDTGDGRGAIALDIAGEPRDRAQLIAMIGSYRSSLAGALALHIAHQRVETSHALIEASRELSRLVDPESVTRALLRRAMSLTEAQTGSVMLLDDDGRLYVAASKGLPPDVGEATNIAPGEGIAGWVYTTQRALVVEDTGQRARKGGRHGIRTAMSAPIADEDGVLGVLNVGSAVYHARFTRSTLDALEALGAIAAVTLRAARAVSGTRSLYFDTMKALALALETKDPYARGGTERVIDISERLGVALGLSEQDLTALRIASMLHDLGMSAAGDTVLIEDRPLSTVEWGMLKMHPVIAADVLEQTPALREAIPIVYHHHERYDGTGYLTGLSRDRIPLGARILSVADSFVAMTSPRPYRSAMSTAEALAELEEYAGSQFDPDVVTVLQRIMADSDTERSTFGL